MVVDRSRFLLLTASLAAAACDQTSSSAATPDTGSADPASSAGDSAADSGAVWLEIEPGTEDPPPGPAGDCNNQIGAATTCSLSPPAGHCESFDYTQQVCSGMSTFLQPRAAEAAVACMVAASGTDRVCEWDFWNQCIGAGVQATCIEPATRSECESVVAQCGGNLDVTTCQLTISAAQPHLQSQVLSCVRESCETTYCLALF